MKITPLAARPASEAAPVPSHNVVALPKDLPWPDALPKYQQLRGRDNWMNWSLASIKQPAGFDSGTGKPLFHTIDVVAAPYPEFRSVVRLPKTTAFKDVISAARALSVDGNRSAKFGNAQAVLQSTSGSWYITTAGVGDRNGHVEPLPVTWAQDATAKPRQRDVVALVDNTSWVNFSAHSV